MQFKDEELESRFSQHRAETPERQAIQLEGHKGIMESFIAIASDMNALLPDGREKAIVMTHLEDASMWANKAWSHQFPAVPDRPLR